MRQVNQVTIQEYLSEAEEILDTVAEELINLEQSAAEGDPDPEVVNAIFRGAHSLKGISAMFGFDDITEVAHKLETLLDAIRMGKVACSRPTLDILFEGLDVIKGLCAQLVAKGGAEHDPTIKIFVDRILAMVEGRAPAAPPEGEPEAEEEPEPEPEPEEEPSLASLNLSEDTLRVLTDYEVHRLEANVKDPRKHLASVFVSLPLMTLDTEMEALTALAKPIGEIISTLPAAGELKPDELDFQLLAAFKVGLEEVARVLAPVNARVETLLKPAVKKAAKPKAAVKKPVPEPEQKAAPSREEATPADDLDALFASAKQEAAEEGAGYQSPPRDEGAPRREPSERSQPDADIRSMAKTIRVDLPKLDLLMNLVGELVLTKGRFLAISDRMKAEHGFSGEVLEMSKAQKELERRLGELQQAVMEVRMVPMGQLFSKLHRVVRKIVQSTPKKVNLEISGSETQLDKLIVEDISDPLIHVIRNAVDHGIEAPDDRALAGKPPVGTVWISASQQGNYVTIQVTDDGAGMDVERIRAKATRLGIIRPGEECDKKRLLEFVFLPGFSTKEQVTELSGRGVGMDVLRKNVANISGMIELDTEKGYGTTVKIILPITLAIIQALLVQTAGETFAIPLNTVLETVVVEEEHLRSLEGRPMLRLRERTLPLVDVGFLFGLAGEKRIPPFAVIVGIAEKRVAFGVDSLLTQRDVVIKSLGQRLMNVRGISGATDLGDSRTVLILDVAEMIEEVYETM